MRLICQVVAVLALVLAFPTIGTAAPGDQRPDPDACQLLTNLDLEPLLFAGEGGVLDSWSNRPAPGEATCRWEGRPAGRAGSATPRIVALAFYHLADRDRARQQLTAQPHGAENAAASLAIDGRGDDELVRSSATVIVARHGSDIAVLDARGSEIADPEQLEARYLLDALALKAAGATVKPPPWAKPGQTAHWVPLPAPSGSNETWTPPANTEAAVSPSLQWPLYLFILVTRHGFLMLFVGIFAPVVVGAALSRKPKEAAQLPDGHRLGRARYVLAPVGIAVLVANLVFGDALADRLLYRFGTAATAMIVGRYATSTQYNNHDVVGYHVLIRPPQGGTIATSFEDDDFNVYPPHNATRYPDQGDVFTVRYLPRFPRQFTIVADDGSPWAAAIRCASLQDVAAQTSARAGFSHNAADRNAADLAAEKANRARCTVQS